MNRAQLEHVIRASGEIAQDKELIIIGSQAILAQHPAAPAQLLVSMEVDLYPKNHPEKAMEIDGAIGELSVFHTTHGYYAHGVSKETAVLAPGWEGRLVPVRNDNTRGVTGWCLEVHDLAVSKLAAGRPKDLSFVAELDNKRLVRRKIVGDRLSALQNAEPAHAKLASERWSRIIAKHRTPP